MWKWCILPENVVEFNLGLFSTLLVMASLELILCLVQMVNGLFGCLCGTCAGKEVRLGSLRCTVAPQPGTTWDNITNVLKKRVGSNALSHINNVVFYEAILVTFLMDPTQTASAKSTLTQLGQLKMIFFVF